MIQKQIIVYILLSFCARSIKCFLIGAFLTLPFFSFSQQNETDSLKSILLSASTDSVRIHAYISLCWELRHTNPQLAIQYAKEGLTIAEKLNYQRGLAYLYNNIGQAYFALGEYEQTLNYSLKSLKIKEELNDKRSIAGTLNNIGLIYKQIGNLNEAYNYYTRALAINEQINNKAWIAINLNNMGHIEKRWGNLEKALHHYEEATALYSELNDSLGIADCFTSIGIVYFLQNKFQDAISNYLKAKLIFEEAGKTQRIVMIYTNLGEVYLTLGKFAEAQQYLVEGLALAHSINLKDDKKQIYLNLSNNYAQQKNFKKAYEYHKLFSEIKDSIFSEQIGKQIAEMATKYEIVKKEKEIEVQKVQLEKKEVEIKQQKTESKTQRLFLWIVALVALAVAVIATVIFRSLRVTKKQKNIIEKQKIVVEEHQKDIIDSITYAKRLQQAILPPIELIKKHFPECFLLYKPKDIVAGDFYWMEEKDDMVFIAAADCTGHGVPGAIVSVVCSNALNRTVKEFGLLDTGKILDKVTDLVLETFEKSSSEVKDGMDISLLSYNKTSKQIQWSGANNSLCYFVENEVKEIKGNRQPIGKFDNRKPFTTHNIAYSVNSLFYLFTDGIPDQFGGSKGKKYLYKRFEENLISISNLTMKEQQTALEKAFQDWKGILEQVDDVTVIGIKI